MRTLLTVEPRAYREAIGNTLKELRPHLEVVILNLDELEDALARLDPDLVICDRPVPSNYEGRAGWVEYYPLGEQPATVSLDGQHTKLEELKLEELLTVVDKAEELSQSKRALRSG